MNQAIILLSPEQAADPEAAFRSVGGLPLLVRTILSAHAAGIRAFHIVTDDETIRRRLRDDPRLDALPVTVEGRIETEAPFLLLFADRIFSPDLLSHLLDEGEGPLTEGGIVIGIDRGHEGTPREGGLGLRLQGNRVTGLSDMSHPPDAVEVGAWLCPPGVSVHLGTAISPATLLSSLLASSTCQVVDLTDIGLWAAVTTSESAARATKRLLESCRKPVDGIISRHFNRHVSLWITSKLLDTPVRANHVTIVCFLLGVLDFFLLVQGKAWSLAVAGLLFQFISILDGCDGEISRIKFQQSKFGAWFDTTVDHSRYLLFLLGVGLHAKARGAEWIYHLSLANLSGMAILVVMMYLLMIRMRQGTGVAIAEEIRREATPAQRRRNLLLLLFKLQPLIKQDFTSFFFMLMALFQCPAAIEVMSALGIFFILLHVLRKLVLELLQRGRV
ncbi:MAG: CDP-alcohol phosphatidyltransferase family protein [Deltaproteobacteria bacterium]|nr:MAG: CDP-alcohol phosphatidyltransferase family protein [Deltaproteobacteria bacterium]